jgi:hypothetical protein
MCVYVYQVIERQWEPLCVVKVFDRAPYPKFGRFPGGMDLAVGFATCTHMHMRTRTRAHTVVRSISALRMRSLALSTCARQCVVAVCPCMLFRRPVGWSPGVPGA